MTGTIKLHRNHLTDVDVKAVVFSGGVNDYDANQTGIDTVVCIAPYAMRLVSFTIRAKTLESAGGTVDVTKVASGTALTSGTAMVTQVVPTGTTLTAATNYAMALHATEANYTVAVGDMVVLALGTCGELTGLAWIAVFERV
jgi:hypothetical protein